MHEFNPVSICGVMLSHFLFLTTTFDSYNAMTNDDEIESSCRMIECLVPLTTCMRPFNSDFWTLNGGKFCKLTIHYKQRIWKLTGDIWYACVMVPDPSALASYPLFLLNLDVAKMNGSYFHSIQYLFTTCYQKA